MLDINVITKDGITNPPQLEGALELAQSQKGILWVNMKSFTDDEIDLVTKTFNLHQIESESLKEEYTRPHLYEYTNHFHANFTYIDIERGQSNAESSACKRK